MSQNERSTMSCRLYPAYYCRRMLSFPERIESCNRNIKRYSDLVEQGNRVALMGLVQEKRLLRYLLRNTK